MKLTFLIQFQIERHLAIPGFSIQKKHFLWDLGTANMAGDNQYSDSVLQWIHDYNAFVCFGQTFLRQMPFLLQPSPFIRAWDRGAIFNFVPMES